MLARGGAAAVKKPGVRGKRGRNCLDLPRATRLCGVRRCSVRLKPERGYFENRVYSSYTLDQMRDDDSRVVLDGKGRDLLADERLKKAYLGL